MYYNYTDEELRSFCRSSLESFEIWARRLIHEKMSEKYGESYIDKKLQDGNYIVKGEIRDHVHKMMKKEQGRYGCEIDTLFMEHIIYFLCHPTFYKELFKDVLKYSYPQGAEEVRVFLERLIPIRNALSHSRPISVRQAEQAICYSNDFIEGMKKYEKERGQEKVWNVPRIIRITDSFGNMFENPTDKNIGCSIFNILQQVYCGDTYSVSVDIDASFTDSDYDIVWNEGNSKSRKFNNCKKYTVTFTEQDVEESHYIRCKIISKKRWHKYKSYDCCVSLCLTVLPPKE